MNAFDLDAAIIFADILPPLEGMGLQLEFVKGEGPVIRNPVRTAADIAALRGARRRKRALSFTLEAIRLVRRELDGRGLPLIGFSGAPFTLASYAIEGGSSRNLVHAKRLMMGEPKLWAQLMEKLSEVVGHYLLAQARAGAQVLQLFDSWAGAAQPRGLPSVACCPTADAPSRSPAGRRADHPLRHRHRRHAGSDPRGGRTGNLS